MDMKYAISTIISNKYHLISIVGKVEKAFPYRYGIFGTTKGERSLRNKNKNKNKIKREKKTTKIY